MFPAEKLGNGIGNLQALDQVKKNMFLVQSSKKKESGRAVFFSFVIYYFLLHAFFMTLLPSPRDTLELLGKILIKRNIRY